MPLLRRLLLVGLATLWATFGQTYTIKTIAGSAGSDALPVNIPGTSASLIVPSGVAADAKGNVYISLEVLHIIVRLDATTGILTLAAGTGTAGFSGDNGPATSAQLGYPRGLALDSAGNLYVVDIDHPDYYPWGSRVRKVSNGVITTVAGDGTYGFSGDNGPATNAKLDAPSGVAVDSSGNLYIADFYNSRIRKVSNGVITTVAGIGGFGFSGDDGPATSARLNCPSGIAVDSSGNLYIADYGNDRIRKVSNGVITTVAGNGTGGFSGDNGPATSAELNYPWAIAVDSAGNLYICDNGNNRVRKVSNGMITTVAGNGTYGFGGDTGPATSAMFFNLFAIAVDSAGKVYIADTGNQRIRKVANGFINTVAGNGLTPSQGFSGDNGPATSALLNFPNGVAVDKVGAVYISDGQNNRVRKVSNGVITTVAGNGTLGFGGDNGPATSAKLDAPSGVAVDSAGSLYIPEGDDSRVRKVSNGVITTVAGNGTYGFSGDNGPATSAQLRAPTAVAVDPAGNLYIADTFNHRVRKVSKGVITAVAGNGIAGFSGDNGSATSAQLNYPMGVAVDSVGNLYVADSFNSRVREVSNGVITTVAGNGIGGFSGDDGPAISAQLNHPTGVAMDPAGTLFIADAGNSRIRRVSGGAITTVAGNGTNGFSGDNGPAIGAGIAGPVAVAVDSAGTVYVADTGNNRIRVLTLSLCTYSASPTALQAPSSGANLTVSVQTAASCSWTVSGLPGWITVSGKPDVIGPGIVTFIIAANTGYSARSAPISIAGISVAVTQEAFIPGGPTISAVVGAGGSVPAVTRISPGGLATVYGANFAPAGTSRQVQSGDLVGGNLPTQLAGVCVTFNAGSKSVGAGGLTYVSPTQVNFQVPSLPLNTDLSVVVSRNCGTANVQTAVLSVTVDEASPELLYWVQNADGRNPVIAVNSLTGIYIGHTGLIAGASFTPAKPGDYLTIYGISFGPTSPAVQPGTAPGATAATTNTPAVMLGTVPLDATNVLYAGVSPGTAGLYQLNIRVPDGLADGDYPINVRLGSFVAPPGGYLTVRNIAVNDFSFEQLILPSGGWGMQPDLPNLGSLAAFSFPSNYAGWSFAENSGVTLAGTDFNPPSNNPDGLKSAVLQGNRAAVNQAVSGLKPGVTYTVSLYVGTRYHEGDSFDGNTSVDVKIDGILIGTTGLLPSSRPFSRYSFTFTVGTPGSHDLSISNSGSSGDHTAFVDNVEITDTIPAVTIVGNRRFPLILRPQAGGSPSACPAWDSSRETPIPESKPDLT